MLEKRFPLIGNRVFVILWFLFGGLSDHVTQLYLSYRHIYTHTLLCVTVDVGEISSSGNIHSIALASMAQGPPDKRARIDYKIQNTKESVPLEKPV